MGVVYDAFVLELADWSRRFAGRPDREMLKLLFLSLEREELVSVNYREDMILQRLASMPVEEDVRKLIHHALVWAWKDEQMHSVYLRGAILRSGNLALRARAYSRQMAGAIGGWAGSVRQHVRWSRAPISHTLATLATWAGLLTGQVPRDVREYLRFRPFRDFCEFNIDAEKTARLCYERMLELLPLLPDSLPQMREDMEHIREDEENHERVFTALAEALDENDRLVPGETADTLAAKIADVGEFFLPRSLRQAFSPGNPVGSGEQVWVRQADKSEEKAAALRAILEDSGLRAQLECRASQLGRPVFKLRIAVKIGLMLGYSSKDRSTITDPELVATLSGILREWGCTEITVLESPNIYDRYFANRTVTHVGRYFGYDSPDYQMLDLQEEQVPYVYARGMAQHTVGARWKDADFRITFGKMRSHPTEFVYLTIGNLDAIGTRCEEFLFPERQAHRDTAVMMLMSDFPPHFALLDAFDTAGDGLVGMMACPRPPAPRRLYAGTDALAVDLVAARHMGLSDPRRAHTLNTACHWFGDPTETLQVQGTDTPLSSWRGPYQNEWTTLLSVVAYPIYEFASGRGALFVPEMDAQAFPPVQPVGWRLRWARRAIQALLGIRHGS